VRVQYNDGTRRSFGSLRLIIAGLALLAIAGCSTASGPSGSVTSPAGTTQGVPGSTAATSSAPTPDPTGFAFEAVDVEAYYQSIGYACSDPTPSAVAAGYRLVTCQLLDSAGRTRVVGLVTDAAGELGNAYAAVWGRSAETYLDPNDALDPLAAFLGTMLGETRGGDAAEWLKEHLGATFERTMVDAITVATYTGANDDPSELYVEVANAAYLAASPPPSP
jgi:hypothetical protein